MGYILTIGGKNMEIDEDRLIRHIRKRKPEALEKIMDKYMDSIYNMAKGILFNIASEEDVEECVQDVFLDVWNNIEKYDAQRGNLKNWLMIMCKSKALNRRKAIIRKGKIMELDEKLTNSKENLEENYLSKESEDEIITAIKALNTVDREVFLRRYIMEQSIEDICITMKLSRQAVDNRLWRGRNQLKQYFKAMERRSINE